jgi:hypothetical protein
MIAAGLAFVALLAVLAMAYRRLGSHASVERAEVALKEEFERDVRYDDAARPARPRRPWTG